MSPRGMRPEAMNKTQIKKEVPSCPQTALSVALRRAFEAQSVRVLHWKSNVHLDESLAGHTDLDLLLHQSDYDRFTEIMQQLSFIKIESQPWATYPAVEDWLGYDEDSGRFLHIHLHMKILTGIKHVKHLHLSWEDIFFDHIKRDPESRFPIIEPAFELSLLLVRIWAKMPLLKRYTKPSIPDHVWNEFLDLKSCVSEVQLMNALRTLKLTVSESDIRTLFGIAEKTSQSEAALTTIAKRLYAQCKQYRRMSFVMAVVLHYYHHYIFTFSRICQKIRWPRRHRKTLSHKHGFIIAVIGADGSGKSTVTQFLNGWLRYKLDSHLLYMGSGDGHTGLINKSRIWVYRALHRILMQGNAADTNASARKVTQNSSQGTKQAEEKVSFLRKCYHLFDLWLLWRKAFFLGRAKKMRDQGSLFICDRYPQAQFHSMNDGYMQQKGRGFRWAAAYETRLMEKVQDIGPDIVIRLCIGPDEAMARKPDHDIGNIRQKCQIMDALDFAQAKGFDIDASEPIETVLRQAKHIIWQNILVTD